jgi:metal-responsive CopG/Arc/MetJ family transcriptional regulator
MKRLNITLPENVDKELSKYKNKSRFIAEAVKEKIERERKKKLNIELTQAYRDANEEDQKIEKDWSDATNEGWE